MNWNDGFCEKTPDVSAARRLFRASPGENPGAARFAIPKGNGFYIARSPTEGYFDYETNFLKRRKVAQAA